MMISGVTKHLSTPGFNYRYSGLTLGFSPANERRRNKITPSVIGWAQTYNQLCLFKDMKISPASSIEIINLSIGVFDTFFLVYV